MSRISDGGSSVRTRQAPVDGVTRATPSTTNIDGKSADPKTPESTSQAPAPRPRDVYRKRTSPNMLRAVGATPARGAAAPDPPVEVDSRLAGSVADGLRSASIAQGRTGEAAPSFTPATRAAGHASAASTPAFSAALRPLADGLTTAVDAARQAASGATRGDRDTVRSLEGQVQALLERGAELDGTMREYQSKHGSPNAQRNRIAALSGAVDEINAGIQDDFRGFAGSPSLAGPLDRAADVADAFTETLVSAAEHAVTATTQAVQSTGAAGVDGDARVARIGDAAAGIGSDVVDWSLVPKKRNESNPEVESRLGIKSDEKLSADDKVQRAREQFGSGEWCGHFVAWALDQGARNDGLRFKRRSHLASAQKARGYFTYNSYTDRMRGTTQADAQAHKEAGQTRRYFVFEGSKGHEWARKHAKQIEGQGGVQPEVLSNPPPYPPFQKGDVVIMRKTDVNGREVDDPKKDDPTHVAMIKDYNPETGLITLVEGNNLRNARTLDLNDPGDRELIEGIGRPSPLDYEPIAEE